MPVIFPCTTSFWLFWRSDLRRENKFLTSRDIAIVETKTILIDSISTNLRKFAIPLFSK